MLTDIEYRILERLCSGEIKSTKELPGDDQPFVREFQKKGWINVRIFGIYVVDPVAETLLQEYDDALEKKAQESAEQNANEEIRRSREASLRSADIRRDWWMLWLGLFIGWLLGGFTPQEFWVFIKSLF